MHTYEKIVRKSFPPKSMPALVLEAAFFRKGSLLLFGLAIKKMKELKKLRQRLAYNSFADKTAWSSDNIPEQSKLDQIAVHMGNCNLTKFGQDWTENNILL